MVVPSIPGFGRSGPTRDRGWTVSRIAAAFVELMSRLGYRQFGAQFGDWGAFITREIAVTAPDMLVGAHLTMVPSAVARPGADTASIRDLTDADRAEIRASAERFAQMHRNELGYGIVQSTKPQTLAYGLTTHRPGNSRGSPRSSPRGPTTATTRQPRSTGMPCSPTSACTGSPARPAPRHGSITSTTNRPRMRHRHGRPCRPPSRYSHATRPYRCGASPNAPT